MLEHVQAQWLVNKEYIDLPDVFQPTLNLQVYV